jgi:hypothetical protein
MSQITLYVINKIINLLIWLRKSLHPSSATDFNLNPFFHAAPIKFLALSNQNFCFFPTNFQIVLLTHLLH